MYLCVSVKFNFIVLYSRTLIVGILLGLLIIYKTFINHDYTQVNQLCLEEFISLLFLNVFFYLLMSLLYLIGFV